MPEFPTLKDIAERPEPFDALPWALAGLGFILATVALAFVFYPQWRRARRKPKTPELVDPTRAALVDLQKLAATAPNQVPYEVQAIVRTYLHRRHGALGLYRTADELLGKDEPGAPPQNPRLAPFASVLREAEKQRYGRTEHDANALISSATDALEAELTSGHVEETKVVQ